MARACWFCGAARKLTNEHVWPDWLVQEFGKGAYEAAHFRPGKGIQRKHDQDSIELTVRRVCDPCNSGWMSNIERVAKPLLLPLILGTAKRATFNANQQTLVANWIVLRAMVFDALSGTGN